MVDIGVGKNMVRSVRHWGLATAVLAETVGTRGANLYVTDLGTLLFSAKSVVKTASFLPIFNEDGNFIF